MTLVARLSTLLIILLLAGCSQEKVQVIEGSIYGTTYSVKFTENINKEKIHTLVKAELDRIDMVFSTYKEDSMISKFNRHECGLSRCASEEFLDLFWLSDEIHDKSNGAFDPFGFEPPHFFDISRAYNYEDYSLCYIDEVGSNSEEVCSVPYSSAEEHFDSFMEILILDLEYFDRALLDFSAIGKGYAVDRISALIFENGISNYFIDIGGEVSVNGTKFGEPWTWGVNNPFDLNSGAYRAFNAPQSGISIATSGEYRNPGHIWGEGPKDAVSITVIGENTTEADAWATAMYVLGIEKGLKIAEKEGLAVFFIKNDGKSVNSSEWSKIYP